MSTCVSNAYSLPRFLVRRQTFRHQRPPSSGPKHRLTQLCFPCRIPLVVLRHPRVWQALEEAILTEIGSRGVSVVVYRPLCLRCHKPVAFGWWNGDYRCSSSSSVSPRVHRRRSRPLFDGVVGNVSACGRSKIQILLCALSRRNQAHLDIRGPGILLHIMLATTGVKFFSVFRLLPGVFSCNRWSNGVFCSIER